MSLEITKLNKNGDAAQEWLLLKATADIQLNDYLVVDTTYDANGEVSNIFRHSYRFPKKLVKKDDYIVLWTKKGTDRLGKLKDDKPAHFFHWNSDAPVWNDENTESAEVLKVETVNKKTTGSPAPKKAVQFKFRPSNLKFGGK